VALGYPAGKLLMPDGAREICQKTGSKLYIAPLISDVGNRYRIRLEAVNCHTGKKVAVVESEAERRSDVVKMVGVAGHQLRWRLGEPRALQEKFNQPVELSGSASPEALHAPANGTES